MTPRGPRWTGRVELVPGKLAEPLGWRRPRRVFVNSMSDLFHEGLTDGDIAAVFGVMAACPQHTFQVLTKRPERMREWFRWAEELRPTTLDSLGSSAFLALPARPHRQIFNGAAWPLPNVWLGVSVEDQGTADERIPLLLQTPAAARFVSAEPLLGPVRLGPWIDRCPNSRHVNGWQHGWLFDGDSPRIVCYWCHEMRDALTGAVIGRRGTVRVLDWVICGGESGPGARPMHPDWARGLRDQCAGAGVPFFFKQWGEWAPFRFDTGPDPLMRSLGRVDVWRMGKRAAGRLLDGREHNGFPGGAA